MSRTLRRVVLCALACGMAVPMVGSAEQLAGVDSPRDEVTLTPAPFRNRDDNFVNPGISELPKLPGARHVVHAPAGERDMTYHHGPVITGWRGRCYVAWHATQRDERTPPYVGLVASSADLEQWTQPARFSEAGDAAYAQYMRRRFNIAEDVPLIVNVAPRTLHATPDRLYLWCLGAVVNGRSGNRDWMGRIFFTEDGERWREIPPEELDAMEQTQGLAIRNTASNHHFIPLRDGRLMAATMEGTNKPERTVLAPTTSDPTGLTGWSAASIDTRLCPEIGEPGGWQGPDGVLHYVARHDLRLWHAFSRDDGKTWSPLKPQPSFSDSPGNKEFGSLPDGTVWYVGNPEPGRRDRLVLALSRDGWRFDESFLVRWEPVKVLYPAPHKVSDHVPGYGYPSAAYFRDRLVIAYSVCCDLIEVSVVDVGNLPR